MSFIFQSWVNYEISLKAQNSVVCGIIHKTTYISKILLIFSLLNMCPLKNPKLLLSSVKLTDTRMDKLNLAEMPLMDPKFSLTWVKKFPWNSEN